MGFYVIKKDELYHHGILGMKWGKRNGPPYPLSSSAHSSSEKKAGWQKSLSGGENKTKNAFSVKATAHKAAAKVYEINEKAYKKSNKALSSINAVNKNRQLKKAEEAQNAANERKANKVKDLVDKKIEQLANDKTGIAAEVAVELGIYAAYIAFSVGVALAYRAHINKQVKQEAEEHMKDDTPIKKINGSHSEEQDMEAVNAEGFKTQTMEYMMNCTMCSAAYELRRRGYDVEANTTTLGRDNKNVESWYKGDTTFTKSKNYKKFSEDLNNQPEGARGSMHTGVGMFDTKHSMVWEKKDGKVIIRDCQSNTVYNSLDKSIINKKSKNGYAFMRTDNLEIDWDNVRDAIKAR